MTDDRRSTLRELLGTMTWNELIDVRELLEAELRGRRGEYRERFHAHLAAKLTAAREAKGWTIKQAAAAAKVAPSTLARSERPDEMMANPTLIKLADAYGVSLDWLVAYTPDPRLDYIHPRPQLRAVSA